MLEAYTVMVASGIAVTLLVIGMAILVDTLVDIYESVTGKSLESFLGLEEELD